jgi:hypothetical protein
MYLKVTHLSHQNSTGSLNFPYMVLYINSAWCDGCQKHIQNPYPAIIKIELFACCYVAVPGCRQHGILEQHIPTIISRQRYHDVDDGSRLKLYDRIMDNLADVYDNNYEGTY